MSDTDLSERFDLPFFQAQIAPVLPPAVLDFHVHIWLPEHWKELPWEKDAAGTRYMVTQERYAVEQLLDDGRRFFPDRPYHAVCFGVPTPAADLDRSNAYVRSVDRSAGLYPLRVTGCDLLSRESLEREIIEGGFFGYKVFLNWYGDDYGSIMVQDLIGPTEMEVADALGLVVLLHVPRARRLADPEVQQGVRDYARRYPNARIVLAHCGRCYLPAEMKEAVGSVRDLPNVYLDTAMVMDPAVLQICFRELGPERVVFATDIPIANMRGRRVGVMDHWVDLVWDGYAPSAYRVATTNMRATFMVYEIIHAVALGAEMAGLDAAAVRRVFFDNGMSLLEHVMGGKCMQDARNAV